MVKWADYLISEVSYDPSHLILKIKQHTDNGKTISLGEVVDRNTLVDNLGHGAKYMTLYNALEKVRIGKNVRYFRAYEHHYVRIDKNKVASDDLGDLPNLDDSNHEEKPALPKPKPKPADETRPLSTTSSAFFAEPVEETIEPVEETIEPVEEVPKETKKKIITKQRATAKKKKSSPKRKKSPAKKKKSSPKRKK